jgi:hypothetical protein
MAAMVNPTPRRNLRAPILETKIKLPTDQPCQIYPRVSTPEQKKNVSAEMQQDKSFAIQCGWTEDLIIIDKRDLGVSGQLRMEDRLAFRDMLRRMREIEDRAETPEEKAMAKRIRAVIARDVSRLFRNKWGDEPGKFMEICYRYNVPVVTADFVYDFSINWHIDKFKRKCEEAWSHIENHVYGVMLPARDERAYAGYWTGFKFPVGYSIDRCEKIKGEENPNYNKFIVYEKHAKVVRWLFRRYKQLNGNVRALLREIERLEKPLFPDFDEDVPDEVINHLSQYKKVPGGYTIASDAGLRRILTNRVYIGYWIYCGELVSTNNHTAIVDYDDFMFAYNRLSSINLDGTPNEKALKSRQRYAREFTENSPLLKECIEAADPRLRVYPKHAHGRWNYALFKRGASTDQNTPLSTLPSDKIDDIVLRKLVARMMEPQAEKDLAGFLAYEDKAVTEASETLEDIERDILATKALIERLEKQVSLGQLTDEDLQKKANDSYKAAKAELKRLEERKHNTTQIASEDEERRTYKTLMQDVGNAWNDIVMPEEHPRLIYLFIESVVIEFLSPRFFTLTIKWRDPAWPQDKATGYRYASPSLKWTQAEEEQLASLYSDATRFDLLKALPRRSFIAIATYAEEKGMRRNYHAEEAEVPWFTCWLDWQLMQEYGLEERQLLEEEKKLREEAKKLCKEGEKLSKVRGVKIVRWCSAYDTPERYRLRRVHLPGAAAFPCPPGSKTPPAPEHHE